MIKRVWTLPWLILLLAALLLSACGGELTGEPEIEREIEIVPRPTAVPTNTPLPAPTVDPAAADAGTDEGDAGDVAAAAATDTAPAPTEAPADDLIDTGGGDYDLGFSIYVAQCAQCHGASDGVGPSLATMRDVAPTRVEGLAPVDYVRQSILDPGAFVVDGYTNAMPQDYAAKLTEDELAALVTFILEFDPSRMGMTGDDSDDSADTAPAPNINLDDPLAMFDIQGRLIAGTADGAEIPAGLPLELFIFDPQQGVELALFEAASGEGGTFDFTEIPYIPNMAYVVETEYQGMTQGLRVDVPNPPGDAAVTPEIRLYEHTTDPAGVMVTWAVMLIDYAPIDEFGIEVWLSVELANTGDRMVTTARELEDGSLASVALELPVGAFGIQIIPSADQMRYEVDVVDNVPLVLDRSPLRPGQVHTMSLVYYLPYETDATLVTEFGYPVIDAAVLLPNDTVDFDSTQFDIEGQWQGRLINDDIHGMRIVAIQEGETVDAEKDFTLIKTHNLENALPADVPLEFSLEGRPTRTLSIISQTPGSGGTDEDDNWLPLILGATGMGVILVAAGLWWRQRRADTTAVPDSGAQRPAPTTRAAAARFVPRPGASKDVLLAALADLDDAFKAGDIDEENYHMQRATITERLLPLLDAEEE